MLAPAGPPPPQHPLHQTGLFPAPGSLPQPHIPQAPVGAAPGTGMPFSGFAQAPGTAGPVVDRGAAAPGAAGTGASAAGGGTAGGAAGAGTTSSAGAAGAGAGGYFGGQTHGQAPLATSHVGAPGNGYPAHGGRSQTGRREGGGKGHFYRGPRPALSMEPVVNLSGSYVKTDGLLPLDEEGFKAAGVLPWRVTVSGSIEVLLGLSRRNELSIFGGMREQNEAPVETALREFRAETNGVLDDGSIVADIRRDLSRGPAVVWMLGGKYALYPFNVGTLSLMTIRQIVDLPVTIPRSITKAQDPAQQGAAGAGGSHTSEMEGARWVDLAALTLSLPRMSFHRFITSMVSSDPAFKAWAQDPVHATSTEPFEVKKCLPCRYWEAGTCAKGDTCDYMHAGQSGKARPARKVCGCTNSFLFARPPPPPPFSSHRSDAVSLTWDTARTGWRARLLTSSNSARYT